MATLTLEELKQRGAQRAQPQGGRVLSLDEVRKRRRKQPEEEQGLLERLGGSLEARTEKIGRAKARQARGGQTGLETGFQALGQAGSFLGEAVFETGLTGLKAITPDFVEEAVKKGASKFAQSLAETQEGKQWIAALKLGAPAVERFIEKNPRLAANAEALLGIAEVLPVGAGVKAAAKGALRGTKLAGRGALKGTQLAGRGVAGGARMAGRGALSAVKKRPLTTTGAVGGFAVGGVPGAAIGGGIGRALESPKLLRKFGKKGELVADVGERAGRFVKETPGRFGTNIAEKQAEQRAFRAFTEPVKKAVSGGIIPRDAKLFSTNILKAKAIARNMVKRAKKFTEDRSKPDPAELVGSEFRKRTDAIKKIKKQAGKEMGEAAAKLKGVKVENVNEAVLIRLRKVFGLEEIELTPKGDLDFSNTTLAGSKNKSARKSIQQTYNDMQGKDAPGLHRLRQEEFELSEGAKGIKASTKTADEAITAMRQGMADVLDSASEGYKAANKKYAQIDNEFRRANDVIKKVDEELDVDLFNLRLADLGRRLTSNAISRTEIEQVIRNMERIAAKEGIKFDVPVRKTQDFLNALNRYYDITHDASFAGQIGKGIGRLPTSKTGVLGDLAEKTIGLGQITPTTQQKALDELLGISVNKIK